MIKLRYTLFCRIFSAFIAFTFVFNLVLPPGYAQLVPQTLLNLPAPGTMVAPSAVFTPALINGITIHPENPLEFDFIIGTGDEKLQGKAFEDESTKLIKYFLASLTVPEDEMWVNLSPYEKDRIVPQGFGTTEMGRDLLAQDYILKQLTASLMYPEKELGRKFWDKIYRKAREQYGTTEIPVNTFNKVWIVPEKAIVYEHGNSAFVVKSRLKVMLEQDYEAMGHQVTKSQGHQENVAGDVVTATEGSPRGSELVTSQIIREIILPEIEKEVNEGKSFANLRQIYNSAILAAWFKQNLRQTLLGQVYVDKAKTKGVDVEDKTVNEKIYAQYLEAFRKGVYNYIKEDVDPATQEIIPRKYFSGGTNLKLENVLETYKEDHVSSPLQQQILKALLAGPEYQQIDIKLLELSDKISIEDAQRLIQESRHDVFTPAEMEKAKEDVLAGIKEARRLLEGLSAKVEEGIVPSGINILKYTALLNALRAASLKDGGGKDAGVPAASLLNITERKNLGFRIQRMLETLNGNTNTSKEDKQEITAALNGLQESLKKFKSFENVIFQEASLDEQLKKVSRALNLPEVNVFYALRNAVDKEKLADGLGGILGVTTGNELRERMSAAGMVYSIGDKSILRPYFLISPRLKKIASGIPGGVRGRVETIILDSIDVNNFIAGLAWDSRKSEEEIVQFLEGQKRLSSLAHRWRSFYAQESDEAAPREAVEKVKGIAGEFIKNHPRNGEFVLAARVTPDGKSAVVTTAVPTPAGGSAYGSRILLLDLPKGAEGISVLLDESNGRRNSPLDRIAFFDEGKAVAVWNLSRQLKWDISDPENPRPIGWQEEETWAREISSLQEDSTATDDSASSPVRTQFSEMDTKEILKAAGRKSKKIQELTQEVLQLWGDAAFLVALVKKNGEKAYNDLKELTTLGEFLKKEGFLETMRTDIVRYLKGELSYNDGLFFSYTLAQMNRFFMDGEMKNYKNFPENILSRIEYYTKDEERSFASRQGFVRLLSRVLLNTSRTFNEDRGSYDVLKGFRKTAALLYKIDAQETINVLVQILKEGRRDLYISVSEILIDLLDTHVLPGLSREEKIAEESTSEIAASTRYQLEFLKKQFSYLGNVGEAKEALKRLDKLNLLTENGMGILAGKDYGLLIRPPKQIGYESDPFGTGFGGPIYERLNDFQSRSFRKIVDYLKETALNSGAGLITVTDFYLLARNIVGAIYAGDETGVYSRDAMKTFFDDLAFMINVNVGALASVSPATSGGGADSSAGEIFVIPDEEIDRVVEMVKEYDAISEMGERHLRLFLAQKIKGISYKTFLEDKKDISEDYVRHIAVSAWLAAKYHLTAMGMRGLFEYFEDGTRKNFYDLGMKRADNGKLFSPREAKEILTEGDFLLKGKFASASSPVEGTHEDGPGSVAKRPQYSVRVLGEKNGRRHIVKPAAMAVYGGKAYVLDGAQGLALFDLETNQQVREEVTSQFLKWITVTGLSDIKGMGVLKQSALVFDSTTGKPRTDVVLIGNGTNNGLLFFDNNAQLLLSDGGVAAELADVYVGGDDFIYILDSGEGNVKIHRRESKEPRRVIALGNKPSKAVSLAGDDQGNVYVVYGSGKVEKYNAEGVLDKNWTVQRNLQSPSDVEVDEEGNVYLAGAEEGVVLKFNLQGVLVEEIGKGILEKPAEIKIVGGKIFVLDMALNNILMFEKATSSPMEEMGAQGRGSREWVHDWVERTRREDTETWEKLERLFEEMVAGMMTQEPDAAPKGLWDRLKTTAQPLETALARFEEDILRTKERTEWTHLIRGRFMQVPAVLSLLTGAGYFDARREAAASLQKDSTASNSPIFSPATARVEEIKGLLQEIDKERQAPGSGNLPEVAVMSDFHGGLSRFIMLLSDVLNKFSGFQGQLDPNRPIEEQLAAQGLSFKDIKGQIILGGDILDRGKHGIKIFLLIKELVEKGEGKVVYVTGNHDFWAFANLLGLHLPWYKGFQFYGDTEAENLVARYRQMDPALFDTPESVSWWTQRLAEHNADQDAYQKKAFDGKVKEVRNRFIEDYETFQKNWTDPQKDTMEKFIGYFVRIGVTDPYVGLNGLGKTSALWWKQVLKQINQGYEARRSLGAEDAELSVWQEAMALAEQISQEVSARLDQAMSEGKWWYRIFESINTHAYRSVEWSAKDWSSHKGWGDSVIGEINEMIDAGLIHEEKLTQKNYIQSPTLQALARFYRDNFNLYALTPYGDLFSHGGFPVNPDGTTTIFYKGVTYKGRDIFQGLDAVSNDVKDTGKFLREIWEALHLVNTWYADMTTELKPAYIKRNIDQIGISKINKGMGVRHHITGHNPIALGKLAGRPFMAADSGYTHAFADFGMSEKYGGQGGWVSMSAAGIKLRGFESETSDALVDNPRTHVWDKETGQIKKTIENPGLEGDVFLSGAKEQLSGELARLEASSPVGETFGDTTKEVLRKFRKGAQVNLTKARTTDGKSAQLGPVGAGPLASGLIEGQPIKISGIEMSRKVTAIKALSPNVLEVRTDDFVYWVELMEDITEDITTGKKNFEDGDILIDPSGSVKIIHVAPWPGTAIWINLSEFQTTAEEAMRTGWERDLGLKEIVARKNGYTVWRPAASSPVGVAVDRLIQALKSLNDQFHQELEQLHLNSSIERLNTLSALADQMGSALKSFNPPGEQDSHVADYIRDVLGNRLQGIMMGAVDVWVKEKEQSYVADLKRSFQNYQREFENLESIVKHGELKNIKSYWTFGHFVNLDKLPPTSSPVEQTIYTPEEFWGLINQIANTKTFFIDLKPANSIGLPRITMSDVHRWWLNGEFRKIVGKYNGHYLGVPLNEIVQIAETQWHSLESFSAVAGDHIKRGDELSIYRRGESNRVDGRFEEIKGKRLWLTGPNGVKISIAEDQIMIINAASSPVTAQEEYSYYQTAFPGLIRQDPEGKYYIMHNLIFSFLAARRPSMATSPSISYERLTAALGVAREEILDSLTVEEIDNFDVLYAFLMAHRDLLSLQRTEVKEIIEAIDRMRRGEFVEEREFRKIRSALPGLGDKVTGLLNSSQDNERTVNKQKPSLAEVLRKFVSGEAVILRKIDILTGKQSSIPPGSIMVGFLENDISEGGGIVLSNGGRTSSIKKIMETMDAGALKVQTDTSTYEIKILTEITDQLIRGERKLQKGDVLGKNNFDIVGLVTDLDSGSGTLELKIHTKDEVSEESTHSRDMQDRITLGEYRAWEIAASSPVAGGGSWQKLKDRVWGKPASEKEMELAAQLAERIRKTYTDNFNGLIEQAQQKAREGMRSRDGEPFWGDGLKEGFRVYFDPMAMAILIRGEEVLGRYFAIAQDPDWATWMNHQGKKLIGSGIAVFFIGYDRAQKSLYVVVRDDTGYHSEVSHTIGGTFHAISENEFTRRRAKGEIPNDLEEIVNLFPLRDQILHELVSSPVLAKTPFDLSSAIRSFAFYDRNEMQYKFVSGLGQQEFDDWGREYLEKHLNNPNVMSSTQDMAEKTLRHLTQGTSELENSLIALDKKLKDLTDATKKNRQKNWKDGLSLRVRMGIDNAIIWSHSPESVLRLVALAVKDLKDPRKVTDERFREELAEKIVPGLEVILETSKALFAAQLRQKGERDAEGTTEKIDFLPANETERLLLEFIKELSENDATHMLEIIRQRAGEPILDILNLENILRSKTAKGRLIELVRRKNPIIAYPYFIFLIEEAEKIAESKRQEEENRIELSPEEKIKISEKLRTGYWEGSASFDDFNAYLLKVIKERLINDPNEKLQRYGKFILDHIEDLAVDRDIGGWRDPDQFFLAILRDDKFSSDLNYSYRIQKFGNARWSATTNQPLHFVRYRQQFEGLYDEKRLRSDILPEGGVTMGSESASSPVEEAGEQKNSLDLFLRRLRGLNDDESQMGFSQRIDGSFVWSDGLERGIRIIFDQEKGTIRLKSRQHGKYFEFLQAPEFTGVKTFQWEIKVGGVYLVAIGYHKGNRPEDNHLYLILRDGAERKLLAEKKQEAAGLKEELKERYLGKPESEGGGHQSERAAVLGDKLEQAIAQGEDLGELLSLMQEVRKFLQEANVDNEGFVLKPGIYLKIRRRMQDEGGMRWWPGDISIFSESEFKELPDKGASFITIFSNKPKTPAQEPGTPTNRDSVEIPPTVDIEDVLDILGDPYSTHAERHSVEHLLGGTFEHHIYDMVQPWLIRQHETILKRFIRERLRHEIVVPVSALSPHQDYLTIANFLLDTYKAARKSSEDSKERFEKAVVELLDEAVEHAKDMPGSLPGTEEDYIHELLNILDHMHVQSVVPVLEKTIREGVLNVFPPRLKAEILRNLISLPHSLSRAELMAGFGRENESIGLLFRNVYGVSKSHSLFLLPDLLRLRLDDTNKLRYFLEDFFNEEHDIREAVAPLSEEEKAEISGQIRKVLEPIKIALGGTPLDGNSDLTELMRKAAEGNRKKGEEARKKIEDILKALDDGNPANEGEDVGGSASSPAEEKTVDIGKARAMLRNMPNDYYARLGVGKTDDYETIKKAYRELVRFWHPDNYPQASKELHELGTKITQKFIEAWETLKSPEKRRQYDSLGLYGGTGFSPPAADNDSAFYGVSAADFRFMSFEEILNELNNEDTWIRVEAMEALRDFDLAEISADNIKDVSALVEAIKHNDDWYTRLRGMGVLGGIARDKTYVYSRMGAAEGAGRTPESIATQAIIDLLETDPHQHVREMCIIELFQIADADSIRALIKNITQDDSFIRDTLEANIVALANDEKTGGITVTLLDEALASSDRDSLFYRLVKDIRGKIKPVFVKTRIDVNLRMETLKRMLTDLSLSEKGESFVADGNWVLNIPETVIILARGGEGDVDYLNEVWALRQDLIEESPAFMAVSADQVSSDGLPSAIGVYHGGGYSREWQDKQKEIIRQWLNAKIEQTKTMHSSGGVEKVQGEDAAFASSPVEEEVNKLITSLRELNVQFQEKLEQLAAGSSDAQLPELRKIAKNMEIVVDGLGSFADKDSAEIVRVIKSTFKTRAIALRKGLKTNLSEHFSRYLAEFQILELIVERGKLGEINEYYWYGSLMSAKTLLKDGEENPASSPVRQMIFSSQQFLKVALGEHEWREYANLPLLVELKKADPGGTPKKIKMTMTRFGGKNMNDAVVIGDDTNLMEIKISLRDITRVVMMRWFFLTEFSEVVNKKYIKEGDKLDVYVRIGPGGERYRITGQFSRVTQNELRLTMPEGSKISIAQDNISSFNASSPASSSVSEERVPTAARLVGMGADKSEDVGGINLNPTLLDLQIKRDGNGVPLPLPMQPIENMHIEGFLPIIINISPVTNLPFLVGLADTQQDTEETRPAMKAREPEEISALN